MSAPFPPIVNLDWWKGPNSFRLVYVFLTIVAIVGTTWAVRASGSQPRQRDGSLFPGGRRRFFSAGTISSLLLVLLILAGYVTVVLKWEDFADLDDSFFTLGTLSGHNLQPPIWPAAGRFFPLGRQEFNVVRHLTSSVVGYHVVPLAELLVICSVLLLLTAPMEYRSRFALIASVLIAPSIVVSFTGLVFPEIDVVFWLSLFLLSLMFFQSSGKTVWAVCAVLCAQNMVYYKETAFLLILGFAAGRLFLRCRPAGGEGWRFGRLREAESRLDFCLLFVVLLFALYFSIVMHHRMNLSYAGSQGVPRADALLYYLRLDPLAVLLVAIALLRGYLIGRRGWEPSLPWDALAAGAVACYAAYLYLRLCMPYYLAPVDFIAVLYIAWFLASAWRRTPRGGQAGIAALLCVVFLYNGTLSAFRVYERENMIHAKKRIADVILANGRDPRMASPTLFIPFVRPYLISEFAAYLTHRGIPVRTYHQPPAPQAPPPFTIASEGYSADGACVDYMDFVCHAQAKPAPGDLVIELPDGLESESDIASWKSSGESLLSYQPRPVFARWLARRLPYLHVISHVWYRDLPDRWLSASVTLHE